MITFDEVAPEAHEEAARYVRDTLKLRNDGNRSAWLSGHARGFKVGWEAALASLKARGVVVEPGLAELVRQEAVDAMAAEVCAPFDRKRALRPGARA